MPDDGIYYDSYKEDRDLILEYNQVTLSDVTISNVLGIGIDNMTREQAVARVIDMIKNGGVHHVMCLNPYKLMRIRASNDLRVISNMATMHINSGGGLAWASRMLKAPLKERIPVLSFMMDIIRIAHIKEFTIFMVGGKPEIAERAFFNIRKSFPRIRIVGRHGGYFSDEREGAVIEAMRKSEANIIFVGLGFPREDQWIQRIKNDFKNTVFITVGGCIDIISGEVKKAPNFFMERGLDWFYRIITRPWKVGRILRVKQFFITVVFKKIFSGR